MLPPVSRTLAMRAAQRVIGRHVLGQAIIAEQQAGRAGEKLLGREIELADPFVDIDDQHRMRQRRENGFGIQRNGATFAP